MLRRQSFVTFVILVDPLPLCSDGESACKNLSEHLFR